MFEQLSQKLTNAIKKLRGQILTEDNIKDTLDEIKKSLLDSDVALEVVENLLENIKNKAIGQDVLQNLKPAETITNIVFEELKSILGNEAAQLNLKQNPPAIILLVGLQGAGKTTFAAKLARYIQNNLEKKVLLTTTDIYRPSAIDQLAVLAQGAQLALYKPEISEKPLDIAQKAISEAKNTLSDVLIIDTAGRLHIDDFMMQEIKEIHNYVKPVETFFVIDSMMGQDAVNTAKAFNEAVTLTGLVITKLDGDSKGGAALSAAFITQKPIKFISTSEKIDSLEIFHPERIASRILGMGDVLTLIEETKRKIDLEKAQKVARKIAKGRNFDFEDFRDQMLQINKMGGIGSILSKFPGMAAQSTKIASMVDEKMIVHVLAIIDSMTLEERRFTALINNPNRKKRVAIGSGTSVQEVNKFIKQFTHLEKMMKKMRSGKMAGLMDRLMHIK